MHVYMGARRNFRRGWGANPKKRPPPWGKGSKKGPHMVEIKASNNEKKVAKRPPYEEKVVKRPPI